MSRALKRLGKCILDFGAESKTNITALRTFLLFLYFFLQIFSLLRSLSDGLSFPTGGYTDR